VAEGRRYPGVGGVLPGPVRGPDRAGVIRRRVCRQIHARPGPIADGLLQRSRRHQFTLPDGNASSAGALRREAAGHRQVGSGHRDDPR